MNLDVLFQKKIHFYFQQVQQTLLGQDRSPSSYLRITLHANHPRRYKLLIRGKLLLLVFFNVKLNSILLHPPQKASAPYLRQISHSYQASVPYINTNSFFLERPQMHTRPQSVTAPGKQSMLKVTLEWNEWTYMFEAPHHPLHDLGVSVHPWTQTRGDCFCLVACLFTRYHHPFFWLTVPSFFLGDHPATLRAVWMGKSVRMVQLFRIQEWAPELS